MTSPTVEVTFSASPGVTVTVADGSTTVLSQAAEPTVEITLGGIPGPRGASGAESGRLVFHQTTPSASWLIDHVLGAYPQVEVLDDGLAIMDPDVVHGSPSQVAIIFAMPTTGYAILT